MDKSRMLFGIITAVVVVLAALVHYQYLMVQKEKHVLGQSVERLNSEKENLNTELEAAKIDLHNKAEDLTKITQEVESLQKEAEEIKLKLSQTEGILDKANSELSTYQAQKNQISAELDKLHQDYEALKKQFEAVSQAKAALEENLRQRSFLKEALKNLKKEERSGYTPQKAKRAPLNNYNYAQYGNRGFIIKDSKPTYSPNIKVEVRPAE